MIDISAVVPTYNSERTIQECLASLETNNVKEIIVVDGGSTDRTCELVSRFARTRTIHRAQPATKAREVGWREATCELVLFIDSDAYLQHPDALELLSKYFSAPQIAGVSCRVACANPEKLLPRLRDIDFRLSYPKDFARKGITECIANPILCGLFRQEALKVIHGFDSAYDTDRWYAEDLYLLHKLRLKGYRVVTVYHPAAFHYHREDIRDVCAQFYHHGLGRRMVMKETDSNFYRKKNMNELFKRLTSAQMRSRDFLIYPGYRGIMEAAFLMGYTTAGIQKRATN